MKKLLILTTLCVLAACDMQSDSAATSDCNGMHYASGSTEYQHCMLDMKKAEKLNQQNQQMMK